MIPLDIARTTLPLFDLETPEKSELVTGGLTHRLLRVQTNRALYALKLWSSRATVNESERARLEQSEETARLAARHGIPALVAHMGRNGRFLQNVGATESGAQWVSLYPWIEGKTLPPTAALPALCARMGKYLGQLHARQIRFDDQNAPTPEAFARGHFAAILARAQEFNAPFAASLQRALDELESANDVAMRAQLQLRENWVTGHLDFDQKNVLWQNQQPTILDWENAKPIHPALEALGAALSWAGQSAGAPNRESFAAFLNGYRRANSLDLDALELAVDGVLGKWIIWLEFNLQRLLEPQIVGTPEAQIALDAGLHALNATLQLRADGAMYRDWLRAI